MGTARDIITNLGVLLNSSGVGVWDTTGAFQPTDTAVVAEAMPPTPDRAIVLTTFPLTQIAGSTTGRWILQVRTRGLPNEVLDCVDLTDQVKTVIDGLTNQLWGNTTVSQVIFYSSIPMGVDDSVRFEHVTKYYVDLDEPPTPLRPAGGWD